MALEVDVAGAQLGKAAEKLEHVVWGRPEGQLRSSWTGQSHTGLGQQRPRPTAVPACSMATLPFCNQHNTGSVRRPACAPCPSMACLTPRSFTTLPSTGSPPALGPSCAALLLAELELPLPAWNSCSCPMMGAAKAMDSHTLDCWRVCWLFREMVQGRFFDFPVLSVASRQIKTKGAVSDLRLAPGAPGMQFHRPNQGRWEPKPFFNR